MAETKIIEDSVIEENQETPKMQYWWLNICSETLDMEECKIGDKKTILSIFDKSRSLNKVADMKFINWLDCYLVDREDNPHFGVPIAQRELAISLLDYCDTTIDEKELKATMTRIDNNLDDYIRTSAYVVNPPIVLKTKTDRENKFRRTAAWWHEQNKDGSIKCDKEGNRLPRVLDKKKQYKTYYFYRKSQVPTHYYDEAHIGNPDYVQPAPEEDPEISYPDIKSITPLSRTSSPDFNNGDIVVVCKTSTKQITGLLKIVNIKKEKISFQIEEIYDKPISIYDLDERDYISEDLNRLIPLDNKEYKRIRKEIVSVNPKYNDLKYSKDKLLKEAFITERLWDDIDQTLTEKKCIILQGAPGVGKTYLAKRIVYTRMGMKDDSRIEIVQFHPNYTYEDFVIGYKPKESAKQSNEEKKNDGGFTLKDGIFKEFCKEASQPSNSKKDYFFIIDEINRGNISKIFGEAFSLIEKDYRNQRIKLAYSQKYFKIPPNVYIIGLMNTADRSLAMIDFALRRRFRFITIKPAFQSEAFKKYQDEINNETFDKLIKCIVDLNEIIKKDHSLGEGFCIGHSYFCHKEYAKNEECLRRIIEYEIIPMLQEYWFDNENKFKEQAQILRNSLKNDKR